ncbi:pre-mRNA-splicing factor 18 [Achlya hypogyna]|uniref:Pre-mRNA-splicing factor 18 n=1 Tax=Achlya hypogyna TaxID=1202772 RepID=A0A1V9YQX2_ACHHY|nr:pre-mRNA-splicing factor 18 [Achlya hypogyna]
MEAMKAMMAKMKRQREAEKEAALKISGEPASKKKYLRRGEIEAALEEEERQAREAAEAAAAQEQARKEREEAKKAERVAKAEASSNSSLDEAKATGSVADAARDDGQLHLTLAETKKRLRQLGHPITLFGETDEGRARRLEALIHSNEGGEMDLNQAYTDPQEAAEDKEDDYDDAYDGDAAKEEESDERKIYRFFKDMLGRWEEALANRPEAVKRSAQGKIATRTMKQCKDYIRPLFRLCKSNTRFGPEFCTGKEEEPSPFAYSLPDGFGRPKLPTGSFSRAKREPPTPKPAFEALHRPELPGAFPNVLTTEQLIAIEAERAATHCKVKPPRTKRVEVRVGSGPGSYHIERDTNPTKISVSCGFSKEKRMTLVDFAAQRGWVSESPGPVYLPTNDALASATFDQKHDRLALLHKARTRNDLLLREASAALQPSYKEFEKSFRRLSQSMSASAITSPHRGRVATPTDSKQSGPGSYDAGGTDFVVRRSKRGTFGTAKTPDLLSSLVAAGQAASTPTGPGDYTIQGLDSFEAKTFNTRGGYVPRGSGVQVTLDDWQMQVPANTTLLLRKTAVEGGTASAKELWKAMMKPPDPQVLGYDS